MDLKDIRSFAQKQKDDWAEKYGVLSDFDREGGTITLTVDNMDGTHSDMEFSLNDNAEAQTYKRLGLGGTYKDWIGDGNDQFPKYKRNETQMQDCIDKRIEQMEANSRLAPTRVLYDSKSLDAKSVMTQKYIRIDNIGVLEQAVKKYGDNYDPNHSWITDNKMMLSFKNINTVAIGKDGIDKTAQVGDIVGFGAQVWNSETGNSSVGVGQFLERLACTNGMTSKMIADLYSFRHIYANLMIEISSAMDKIVNPDRTATIIAKAMKRPAVISSMEEFPKIVKVPKIHHEGIIAAHESEPIGTSPEGINGWGVYNAFTRYAQHSLPYTDGYTGALAQDMMTIAYPLLTL